jgi:hypothetical protein
MVTHLLHSLPVVVFSKRSNRDMTNWSLELDQWVGLIVVVSRHGFAIRAEVCVGTNSAFVSVALDVRFATSVGAKRTIAIDAAMDLGPSSKVGDWLVQSRKPMARVNLIGAEDACRAKVPVWTFQALVSHSSDILKERWSATQKEFCAVYGKTCLVASITNCLVYNTSSGPAKAHNTRRHLCGVIGDWLKSMPWVMAMFVTGEAQEAQVEVRAVLASYKFMLRQF